MKRITLALLSIVLLWACKKDEDKYAPPVDFAVQVALIATDSAQIVWSKSIDPDDYILVYDVYLEDTARLKNSRDTSFVFRDLLPNKLYEGYVLAKDFSDGFTRSNFSFRTYNDLEQDSANFYVNSSEITDTTAQLSWGFNGVVGIKPSKYDVYLGGTLLQSGVTDTLYSLDGLKSGTLYQGKVVAIDDSVGTVQRNYEFTTTGIQQAEGVTITIDTVNVTHKSAGILWEVEDHPTFTPQNYDVYLDGNQVVSSTANKNYTFNNLDEETSYTGKIVARGFFGEEAEQEFSFATYALGPIQFSVQVTEAKETTASISYEVMPHPEFTPANYDVYLNGSAVANSITELTYDFDNLTPETSYEGYVIARNALNETVQADFMFETLAPATTDISVTMDCFGKNTIKLNWYAVEIPGFTFESYDLYLDGTQIETGLTPKFQYYSINNLDPNTTYEIKIVAHSTQGDSVEWIENHKTTSSIIADIYFGFTPTSTGGDILWDLIGICHEPFTPTTWQLFIDGASVVSGLDASFNYGEYQLTGLNPNTSYSVEVKIFSAEGESASYYGSLTTNP